MILRRTEEMLRKLETRAEALLAGLRTRQALKLWARLRRHQNALLAVLLGLGILLMVIHWSGSSQRSASAQFGARPAPPAAAHADASGERTASATSGAEH